MLICRLPFSLRHYQSDMQSHSHDHAQLVIPSSAPRIEVQGPGMSPRPGFACIIALAFAATTPPIRRTCFWCRRATGCRQPWGPPFVELDEAQRHYLAFLHRMVAEGATWPAWIRCGSGC